MKTKTTIAEKFGFKTKLDADTQERLYTTFKDQPDKFGNNGLKVMWKYYEGRNDVVARFFKNCYQYEKIFQKLLSIGKDED